MRGRKANQETFDVVITTHQVIKVEGRAALNVALKVLVTDKEVTSCEVQRTNNGYAGRSI